MTAASVCEPRVRGDGRCARPGCNRKLPRSKRAKKYAGDWLDLDPWCSSRCCRAFYGCSLASEADLDEAERRSERGRRGKEAGQLARRAA